MEIVLIVLGIVAVAGLVSTTLRMRSSRRSVRRSGAAQWRGSAGAAARSGRGRIAAVAAPVAVATASSGGTAVQDPPRTRVDEDGGDDAREWRDPPRPAPAVDRARPAETPAA